MPKSVIHRISILLVLLLTTLPLFSQFNTYSPYTRFGLGDLSRKGFGQNLSMGGAGIALQEGDVLNYINPASYVARDSMSVLFDFGLNGYANQYQTRDYENMWYNANFHHIAISAPIGKHMGMAAGLVPYSSVGYNMKQEYNNLPTGDPLDFYYSGDGGIMNFFLGTSVQFFDRVSLGVNMNYLLGNLNRNRYIDFPTRQGLAVTRAEESIVVGHTLFNFGLQYKETFGENFFFVVGATYDLETNLKSSHYTRITNEFPGSGQWLSDSVYVSEVMDITRDTLANPITIPSKLGVGVSVGIPNKLVVTGDYTMQDWSNTMEGDNFKLVNASSMNLGLEYTPDYEALRGYHKLMSYRLGGYYSNYYLQVNGQQIKDYGITFGVGLPMKNSKTSFNFTFTLGTRGSMENNLIKENYGIATFNVTLHDLWFFKRKFE